MKRKQYITVGRLEYVLRAGSSRFYITRLSKDGYDYGIKKNAKHWKTELGAKRAVRLMLHIIPALLCTIEVVVV